MKAKKKTWIVKIIILFILIIFLVTLIFISSSLDVANQFYQNVTLPFTNFLNKFLGLIPFSLFEFAVATMVILGFYFVISIIIKLCKRQVFKAFNKILSLFLITLFVLDYFIFTQGIGYNTSNLNLSLYQGEITDTLIYKTTDYYLDLFNQSNMKISGINLKRNLVEAIELTSHPFYVGVQYHPEFLSRVLNPHPLFDKFIQVIKSIKKI